MKLNKIISSALVLVMLFASFCVVIPVSAAEAEVGYEINVLDSESVISDFDKIKLITEKYKTYNFASAKEMLDYELNPDGDTATNDSYLDSVRYGNYVVYVNRYTGFMYYVNELTGQILTSNPIDPGYRKDIDISILSQLEIEFFKTTDAKSDSYTNFEWLQIGSLMTVSKYNDNGIAVEYTLGPAESAYIAPSVMLYDTANEYIMLPAFEKIAALLQEKCGDFDQALADSKKLNITSYNATEQEIYRDDGLYNFFYVSDTLNAYSNYAKAKLGDTDAGSKEIGDLIDKVNAGIFSQYAYSIVTAEDAKYVPIYNEKVTALQDGKNIIILNGVISDAVEGALLRKVEKAIKAVAPEYTFEMAEQHEDECGFKATSAEEGSFKITLCYSLDENGDLVVDIPSNLITFNEANFAIKNITPLKYFGAGETRRDGYIFYPDGSGTIVDFKDFSSSSSTGISIYIDSLIYGYDYCYSTVASKLAHREQITMPVYGIVSDVNSNNIGASQSYDTVTNGYFAIIEEGSSLSELHYFTGGGTHKYISVHSKYAPNPYDTYDLSQSISVSGLGSYTVVAPASYGGSLKTKYTMLTDPDILAALSLTEEDYAGYETSYVGMANCYRDYLEKLGAIEPIGEVLDDLPLYIEALGSISITKKVLSFPVTTSVPLTTFDDVAMMYRELSDAYQKILDKAADHQKTADDLKADDEAKHADEIARNLALVEKYNALAEKIKDVSIKNINFRLTGFTNGGMHFTYPAKVKWEKSTGGKKGLNELLGIASDKNKEENANFGIYPDFDFMYINNTSAFDAVNVKKIAACMVDNRYASKQVYNSVQQGFESMFALVVSTNSLDLLYNKFLKQYSKYDFDGISVSTLGSDLNSNFNVDDPMTREDGISKVTALLSKMSSTYSVMSDKGNIYAVKYLDHILNAPIDSSHLNYSSYSVPFYGMVLHGYVNYAGTPINYSGSPDYEILRSIENGAALYYILCTQNTGYLKNDSLLSKYYGVDYHNLFDKIVEQYAVVDAAIGDLQQHKIVNHSIIFAERVIVEKEMNENYNNLVNEFVSELDKAISLKIDAKIKEMRENGMTGVGVKLTVSADERTAIIANAAERLNLDVDALESRFAIGAKVDAVIKEYTDIYNKETGEEVAVTADDIRGYVSQYNYMTDSIATDKNYHKTDFTCDNGNVVMVTYEREVDGVKDTVVFLLNYNIFSVKIKVDATVHANFAQYCDKDGYITLDSFGFAKIK